MKLCSNLVAGATMAALAEACAIAEREGIDAATLYEILTMSTADSRVLRVRFPLPGVDASHPSSSDYDALFALDLIAKDLALVAEVDRALTAHELINVRVGIADRHQREEVGSALAAATDDAVVQRVGKVVVLWRPRPDEGG